MPGLSSLAGGIRPIASQKTSDLFITELDKNGSIAEDSASGFAGRDSWQATRRFQYFPDTITDTKQVNWEAKEVPGGSLPIYQWINSGAREISFTSVFTSDVDHFRNGGGTLGQSAADAIGTGLEPSNTAQADDALDSMYGRLKGQGVLRRNVYIPAALVWLRRFMLPRYAAEQSDTGTPFTFPPRKLLLTIPGTQIHLNGGGGSFGQGGGIVSIMTGCDITYEALFPSGNPRIVTVALTFAQVPQLGDKVVFPRWDQTMDAMVGAYYGGTFTPGNAGGASATDPSGVGRALVATVAGVGALSVAGV